MEQNCYFSLKLTQETVFLQKVIISFCVLNVNHFSCSWWYMRRCREPWHHSSTCFWIHQSNMIVFELIGHKQTKNWWCHHVCFLPCYVYTYNTITKILLSSLKNGYSRKFVRFQMKSFWGRPREFVSHRLLIPLSTRTCTNSGSLKAYWLYNIACL